MTMKKLAPLGSGARFAALKAELARRGARDPAALAAFIGRKKLGKAKFQQLSEQGRRRRATTNVGREAARHPGSGRIQAHSAPRM